MGSSLPSSDSSLLPSILSVWEFGSFVLVCGSGEGKTVGGGVDKDV
jgi:hypothetical protein